eukprot:TRINITY_DN11567_c0_g1_i1.p1 TRINITY_DN11567_c0_g1~~TRINITY_DN11567_c0_g1_i1.p1  ORF type:complete len:425 (-),score=131.99 TRINITY_DN11567_c0_g1_i1:411-1685(-)
MSIKTYGMKILSILIAEDREAKESIRDTEILKQVLKMAASYPTYDVDLTVLEAALNVLSHLVTSSPGNQNLVRELNGFSTLAKTLSYITKQCADSKEEDKLLLAVVENICLCLSNMCFHNPLNQETLLKQGVIKQLLAILLSKNNKVWWLPSQIIQEIFFIFVNATDTNAQVQEYLLTFAKEDLTAVVSTYLFADSFLISGHVALWISHIAFNCKPAQELLATSTYVQRLFKLCDYKELLVSLSDELAQQIAFFALLAIINLTFSNTAAQQVIYENGGIKLLCSLLSERKFEAKKTVCFALSNVIRGNPTTQKELLSLGGLKLLLDLVSDEEDDELSKKAFNTLEDMNKFAIDGLYPLIIEVAKHLTEDSATDISLDTNRIVLVDNSKPANTELLIQCKEKLEKYLPIYNGLIYMDEGMAAKTQ